MDSYLQCQISQSDCEISSSCGKINNTHVEMHSQMHHVTELQSILELIFKKMNQLIKLYLERETNWPVWTMSLNIHTLLLLMRSFDCHLILDF